MYKIVTLYNRSVSVRHKLKMWLHEYLAVFKILNVMCPLTALLMSLLNASRLLQHNLSFYCGVVTITNPCHLLNERHYL